ncbi:unnamed protein product [Ectocarpus sp. 4 AP-2014]
MLQTLQSGRPHGPPCSPSVGPGPKGTEKIYIHISEQKNEGESTAAVYNTSVTVPSRIPFGTAEAVVSGEHGKMVNSCPGLSLPDQGRAQERGPACEMGVPRPRATRGGSWGPADSGVTAFHDRDWI